MTILASAWLEKISLVSSSSLSFALKLSQWPFSYTRPSGASHGDGQRGGHSFVRHLARNPISALTPFQGQAVASFWYSHHQITPSDRVVLRMKPVLYSTFALLAASPAFAEVCDKVRRRWDPTDGPINQFDELSYAITSPLGFGLLLLMAVTLLARKRWLSISCAVVLLLMAGFTAAVWFWIGEDIIHAAHREGCRAPPFITIGVLALLAGWFFLYHRPP